MNYYQEHKSEFLEGLKAFLRIPSIRDRKSVV